MLGATMNKTFTDLFGNAYKNTDAVVRGPSDLSGSNEEIRPTIDESVAAKVSGAAGVGDSRAEIMGFAQLIVVIVVLGLRQGLYRGPVAGTKG